jgi:1,4-dihydroxy-2-naphthoate octaprenyltransferase
MALFEKKIRAWVALSRPPFHIVGVLPFILGGVLAGGLTADSGGMFLHAVRPELYA